MKQFFNLNLPLFTHFGHFYTLSIRLSTFFNNLKICFSVNSLKFKFIHKIYLKPELLEFKINNE